jgi:hypothetical protein
VRFAHHRACVSHNLKITSVHGLEHGYCTLFAAISLECENSQQAVKSFIKIVEIAHEIARFATKFGHSTAADAAIEVIFSQPLQRPLLGMAAPRTRDLHRLHHSISFAPTPPLERGVILQSLLDVGAVVLCLLFIAITAGSILWAFYNLFFVRT